MARFAVVMALCAGLVACGPSGRSTPSNGVGEIPGDALTQPAFATDDDPAALVDPSRDGWDSEILSAAAEQQLYRLANWLADPAKEAIDVAGHDFASSVLAPETLSEHYSDGVVTVRQGTIDSRAVEHRGPTGLADGIDRQRRRVDGFDQRRATLKQFRIELEESSFVTRSYFELSGSREAGAKQINSLWTTRWQLPESTDDAPLLMAITVADYEETETRSAEQYEDVTAAAIGHNRSYGEQILKGPEHWLSRLTKGHGFSKDGWHGVSVADVDGDGLEDLFLAEQGGLPNRLFVQSAIGTFDDRSSEAGIDFLERTLAGLFVDLDNDGDQDLVLSHRPAVLILENDGNGRFQDVRFVAGAIPDSHSVSAADFDLDGDLDLYVCAYRRAPNERGLASPVPYHDANNGGRNALLRNDGGFQFTDVTAETGLDANNRRFSLAAAWEDFDNDGDPDLYVANDYGRNNLYRNDAKAGGQLRFTDIAAQAGVEDVSSGMSVSWADYDRDGRMDVYVGNMFSAAGNRITYQRKFDALRRRAGPLAEVQRMTRGNSLFRNAGPATFHDRSEAEAVTMGRWSWSSLFADINNDGWEDLVIANGNLTQTNPDDL
ncbi:MAG: VCBS repeat-containing protein [Acidobacteriota bacterium]|nr:VCBS repeat-containing protein [Acidobacteriota bacterium]